MFKFKPAYGVLAIGALALLSLIVFYVTTTSKDFTQPIKQFDELGGDFTLMSYDGEVSLSQYKGQAVVMYFGYMSCAEVCPNSLMVLTMALKRLDAQGINATKGLFVTVDPSRDTPDKLKEFTDYFHPRITGLTGSPAKIKAMASQYGVYFDSSNLTDSFMEYSVDHASRFYIISPQGKLVTTMSHTTTPNELAAQLKEILNEVK